jgi:hypothetical protein
MRIGSSIGLSGVALIGLIVGSGCSGGTTTVYQHQDGTPADPPGTTDPTMTTDPTKPDPSMQGDPTSKDTPAPPLVAGLAITDVAVFQAVKVPIVASGKALAKAERNARSSWAVPRSSVST